MRRRRKHENLEEHENHERWLVSYADFITLLFAFFVVMYSVSSVNEGKYRVLSEVLGTAFRSPIQNPEQLRGNFSAAAVEGQVGILQPPSLVTTNLQPLPGIIIQPYLFPVLDRPAVSVDAAPPVPTKPAGDASGNGQRDPLDRVMKLLEEALQGLIRADLVAVRRSRLWVEVEIKNSVLFPSGSAIINESAREPLKGLAAILQDIPNRIQVEGFTDNVPISTPVYPSNWELSASRAASVVHLLMRSGIRPERMAAVGYGEYRPIADNATEQGRNRNRRVVLVILGDMNIRQELPLDAGLMAAEADIPALVRPRTEQSHVW